MFKNKTPQERTEVDTCIVKRMKGTRNPDPNMEQGLKFNPCSNDSRRNVKRTTGEDLFTPTKE